MNALGWLPAILAQRARCEQDWNLSRIRRWAYTAKAIVCLLLNRHLGPEVPLWEVDKIEVAHGTLASTYSPDFGAGGNFDFLAVGPGAFRRWWFVVGYTGWP